MSSTVTQDREIPMESIKSAFAAPGESSLIDIVHPFTGLGVWSHETLEQIRGRHPGAVIVNIDAWCEAKAALQDSPIVWDEISQDQFCNWLECLPPEILLPNHAGFLVGEPSDHHATTGRARFQACKKVGAKYYASSRPMTRAEFRAQFGGAS